MSVVKIKIPGIVSIKKTRTVFNLSAQPIVLYRTDDMFSKTSNVHVKWTAAYKFLVVCHMSAIEIMFLSINRTLLNVDRYLYTFCSFKMSEEIIQVWAIFLGFYIFLLVLFFLNIYFISSFLILYIVLRFIQSKNKKLLSVKSKAVLVTGCDRGKSIHARV